MASILKRFLKDSSIYGMQPFFKKAISFFLIPLYTAYLTPADYGNLQYILTFGAFFNAFIEMGVTTSFWKFRTEADDDKKGEISLNTTLSIILVGVKVFLIAVFLKMVFWQESVIATFIVLYLAGEIVHRFFLNAQLFLRAKFQAKKYLVSSLFYSLVLVSFNILFVAVFQWNYKGIIIGYLCTFLLTTLVYVNVLKREYCGSININLSRQLIVYGYPIMIGNIAAIVITMSDRILLQHITTSSDLGFYSYGYKYADLVKALLISTFFMAWNPLRWEIYKRSDAKEIFVAFYRFFCVCIPASAFVVLSGAILLGNLITVEKEFLNGFSIIPVIGFSHVLYGVYYFNAQGMLFANKTKTIMYIIVVSGISNLMLNLLLIPAYNIYGAALATFLSYLIMLLLGRYYSQRYYNIERDIFFELFQLLLIFGSVLFLTFFLYINTNFWVNGLVTFSFSVLYVLVNFIMKFLSINQIKQSFRTLNK